MNNPSTIKSISSRLLAEEASKRNINVEHLNPYQDDEAFLELNYKNHKEFIIGQRSSKTSIEAYWILENKDLTKRYLKKGNINVAEGKVFNKNDFKKNGNDYYKEIGFPIVIKPLSDAHGNLVFIGINNKTKYLESIKKVFEKNNYVLVEKEFKGKEFRFITNRKKVIAVTCREPANIIGDNIHTIQELIEIKNNDPRRGNANEKPLTKIKIDNVVKQCLADQKITIDSVIPKDKKIFLRKNSNISTGGDSINVTDQAHNDFKDIAIESVCAIPGLPYAGVDLMTNIDISQKPTKNNYIIVEINSSPGIYPQHFPYQGKSINVAKEIINIIFPETKY